MPGSLSEKSMKQCLACYRFLSRNAAACVYCGSRNITARRFRREEDKELRNYRISAEVILVEGREYRVSDILGQGSHGVVLKISAPNGKEFAIKVPLQFNELFTNNQGNRQSVLDMSLKYVKHEVNMLNKIKNEALIDVEYAGPVRCRAGKKESQFPAILMELAYGTLKDLIDDEMENRLPVPGEEKINIIKQLTSNIEKLHHDGFVHRDLSPHNIFIVEREGEIRFVPADFGTSKPSIPYEQRDSTTRMAFHERYMDPALLMHDHIRYDYRIDLYQLGIIVTEILLGEYWRVGGDDTAASGIGTDFAKDFLKEPAVHEIPPAVLKVIRKATTLNIKKRYRSAEKFRKDMHKALDKEYLTAGGKSAPGRLRRNIYISFKRIIPDEEKNPERKRQEILYKGRKKVDMGTGEELRIDFPGIGIKRARIIKPSFLDCRKEGDSIVVRVNSGDIDRAVRPLFTGKRKEGRSRIEFECKSILSIECEKTREL